MTAVNIINAILNKCKCTLKCIIHIYMYAYMDVMLYSINIYRYVKSKEILSLVEYLFNV